jgi:hypothetical protein
MARRFDTQTTNAQKLAVSPDLIAARPMNEGETNNQYLTRISQELLYEHAYRLWRRRKEEELSAITEIS